MKKGCYYVIVCILAIAVCLSSCNAVPYASTHEAKNHVYLENEKIEVFHNDTGLSLGSLTVTGATVLYDQPFQCVVDKGTDESGDVIYEKTDYSMIIQVYYQYDFGDKTVDADDFWISSQDGKSIDYITPRPDYTEIPREGEHSFVLALKEQAKSVLLSFNYCYVIQTEPTAKIRVFLD